MIKTSLVISLVNDLGGKENIELPGIKEDIDSTTAYKVAESIITNDVFLPTTGTKFVSIENIQVKKITLENI